MLRHWSIVAFVALLCLVTLPADGQAIVLEVKAGETKTFVRGVLVGETKEEIVVKVDLPDGTTQEKTFQLSDVAVIYKVNRELLKTLTDPKQITRYAQFADQYAKLAKKHDDPEAKALATRLYLIAASRSSGTQRSKLLVAMAGVARSAGEARRIRALAYLSDPQRDQRILASDPLQGIRKNELPWAEFREALRSMRSGQIQKALEKIKDQGVARCFANIPGFISLQEFHKLCGKMQCPCNGTGSTPCTKCKGAGRTRRGVCLNCNGRGRIVCGNCDGRGVSQELSETQLRTILKTELHLEDKGPARRNNRELSWGSQLSNDGAAFRELSLETVTEFDPKECVYRDGKWEAPSKR
ncbi:MAG: hypothetical protein ACFCD0_11070 [Gemmataceae bacterium]